jgi:hypothetical protein
MTFQQVGAVAQVSIIERWAWYQASLKDPSKIGTEALPIHANEYQVGYYRTRAKGGQWEAVGIYPDDNGVDVGFRGDRQVKDLQELFLWSCRYPISHAAYVKALAGGGFDDEPPAPIGDNSGDADPFEALRIEFEGEAELARAFLKTEVKTQADADKAGIWSKRLADISKRADGEREREKAPHLQASRAVDDKWRPVVGDAKDMAASLKKHVEPFLIAQKRAEEARAKAAAEEAAKQRREAEEALRRARSEETDAATRAKAEDDAARALADARDSEKAAEVRNASAGRTGARVALRTDKHGEIVDYDVLLMALKDRTEIKEIVQSLANRAAKSGFELPGMKIVEIEKVV